MPCYTTRTITLDFKAADAELLAKALEKAGLRNHAQGRSLIDLARRVIADGKISIAGVSEERAIELVGKAKVAYAAEVVQFAGRKFGFNVKASADQRRFTLNKRTF